MMVNSFQGPSSNITYTLFLAVNRFLSDVALMALCSIRPFFLSFDLILSGAAPMTV
jgi:hypothetical protein